MGILGLTGGNMLDAMPKMDVGDTSAAAPTLPPDPYDINNPQNVVDVKRRLEERWKIANHRRNTFELRWLRQVLYNVGVQWINTNSRTKTLQNMSLPADFPRAITNKYAQVMGDLFASLIQGDVPVNFTPATDNTEDISSAEVCERIQEVIDREADTRTVKRDLGFWVTLTGNGFILPYYDYDSKHGSVEVPGVAPTAPAGPESPILPPAGPDTSDTSATTSPLPGDPAATPPPPPGPMDGLGTPPAAEPPPPQVLPVGKLCHECLSPFEIYLDNTVRAGNAIDWFFRPKRYDIAVAKSLWEGFADKITEGMPETFKQTRNYLIAIAYAGSYLSGSTGIGGDAGKDETSKQVTAWLYNEDPSDEYPQGLRVVRLGDEVVELGPLPNIYGAGPRQGQTFHGLTHFTGEVSGGRWAKSRAEDLWPIQARRNIIESNLQKMMQRCAGAKLLVPMGAGLKNVTGEAGQIFEYKPFVMGGSTALKPEYLEGAFGMAQPALMLLKALDDSMERIGGTFFLAGGDAPAGVTAASALSYLGERSNRALAPLKESWVEGWAKVYQFDLEIVRQHWQDERVLSIMGANREWEYFKWKKADLAGAVNVRIDYEAMFPKSQATKRADLLQLSQMGLLNPADPEQSFEALMEFGATRLKPGIEVARAQAEREWDLFITDPASQQAAPPLQPQLPGAPPMPPPPAPTGYVPALIPGVQNSGVHLVSHKEKCATQEFEKLWQTNQPRAQQWVDHTLATQADLMAMQVAMAGPQGPPVPGGHNSAVGSENAHGKPGHPGSQAGSQNGPAGGNAQPASIRKGTAAADAGSQPIPESHPPDQAH